MLTLTHTAHGADQGTSNMCMHDTNNGRCTKTNIVSPFIFTTVAMIKRMVKD